MKRVKWDVIGAGGIADRRTIPGILLACNAQLEAVMEVNMEFAEKIRKKHNATKAYDSVDNLLSDPGIDAVYIASPVVFHREQAIKAARAKKHILIEKPVALTASEANEVVKICRSEGVLAAAGFMMRFGSYNMKMKEIIQAGTLGKIVSCGAQFTCWYPDMENAWRQKKSLGGGGALMDMGVHCIDLIQFITGSKVKKVAALNGTRVFNYEVEDSSTMMFELDNGAFCHVDSYFNIPDEAAKWRVEFYGTRGHLIGEETIGQVDGGDLDIVITGDNKGYDAQQDKKDGESEHVEVELGNMYAREIESFGRSVLEGIPVEVPVEEAVQVQKVIEAAYESSADDKFVRP